MTFMERLGSFTRGRGSSSAASSSGSSAAGPRAIGLAPDSELLLEDDRLKLGSQLGRGAFGVVYKCKYDGSTAVAKHISLANVKANDMSLVKSEINIWSQLDHQNLVGFLGVVLGGGGHYLVCDFMPGGSLSRQLELSAQSRSPPPACAELSPRLHQVASGMRHLHQHRIIHRDLKAANVLIAGDGRLCVGDFGLSRSCDSRGDMTAETGSYRWMAPEVVRHEAYGLPCDVYSFAMLCFEMLSYEVPFAALTPVQAALGVASYGHRPTLRAGTPAALVSLCVSCWQQDAAMRPSFEQVCHLLEGSLLREAVREAGAAAGVTTSAAAGPRRSRTPSPERECDSPRERSKRTTLKVAL